MDNHCQSQEKLFKKEIVEEEEAEICIVWLKCRVLTAGGLFRRLTHKNERTYSAQ